MVTVPNNKKKTRASESAVDTTTVTTTQLGGTPCTLCPVEVQYKIGPGNAAAALTEHYNKQHAGELASA